MKTSTRTSFHRLAPLCAALSVLACGGAEAAIGIRVLAQDWNPVQPAQQTTRRLVDEPAAVSDALQNAWRQARPVICGALKQKMGLGGAAGGFTLRDIDCVLDETAVFTVASNGPNGLTALVSFGGYLAATSTTPDHIDRALDPRFSINVRMNLALKIAIQPNPSQTLRVDTASFSLSDARIDSHGVTGDALKFVAGDLAKFFTGTDYKRLAENAVNGVAGDFGKPFNAAFAPINDRLRPPSGLVRAGVWVRPDLIAIAFAPQPMSVPAGGSMSGVFRWNAGETPGRCDGLAIAASVQTGPAPLTGVDGRFDSAYAPRKAVGDFRLDGAGAAGECRYRVTGLAPGWQNDLALKGKTETAEVVALRNQPKGKFSYTLKGDGWDGTHVTPQPAAQGNYVIDIRALANPTIDPSVIANRQIPQVGVGPRPNTGDRFGTDATLAATTTQPARGLTPAPTTGFANPAATALASMRNQPGTTVSLNPQPLPPESTPTRAGTLLRGR